MTVRNETSPYWLTNNNQPTIKEHPRVKMHGSGAASAGKLCLAPHARVRNQSIGTQKMGSGSAYAPALRRSFVLAIVVAGNKHLQTLGIWSEGGNCNKKDLKNATGPLTRLYRSYWSRTKISRQERASQSGVCVCRWVCSNDRAPPRDWPIRHQWSIV